MAVNDLISFRDYSAQKGVNVAWDAAQGALINGQPVNTQGLTNYGLTPPTGYQANTLYGTPAQIDQLLSPYITPAGGAYATPIGGVGVIPPTGTYANPTGTAPAAPVNMGATTPVGAATTAVPPTVPPVAAPVTAPVAAPTAPAVTPPMVNLRDYATQKGLSISWDATQGVMVNGVPVSTQGLTNYGATPTNGYKPDTFYGTQAQIDQILSPYIPAPAVTPPVNPLDVPPPVNPAVGEAATDYQTWAKTTYVPNADVATANADYQAWAKQPYVSEYINTVKPLLDKWLTRTFNYDPANDTQFQQASQELTRNVIETMASRGLLNSTITENQLQQGVSKLLPQYQQIAYNKFQDEGTTMMNQINMLMGMDETAYNRNQDTGANLLNGYNIASQADETAYNRDQNQGANLLNAYNVVSQMDDRQRGAWKDAYTIRYNTERDRVNDNQTRIENDRNAINDAWNETDRLGYVSNSASLILGVAAGTPSQGAREAKIARDNELADQETANEHDREMNELTFENNSKLSTQSYQESSALSAQSSSQSLQNSSSLAAQNEGYQIAGENRADVKAAAIAASEPAGLSENGKALLAQINSDMATSVAPVGGRIFNKATQTKGEMDSANANTKIQRAKDYGTITESDAVLMAVELGLTIEPE